MSKTGKGETLYTHPRMIEVMPAHRCHLLDEEGNLWAGEVEQGHTLTDLFITLTENKLRAAWLFTTTKEEPRARLSS